MSSLAEILGHAPDDRLLIISADFVGSCHAANAAAYTALREGLATTAAVAIPCPWARQAAQAYRGEDMGVHLTFNSQLDALRWGPITHAPSLLDGDGGFPRTVADLWDHADLDEVRREARAQIERAVLWGFNVSHLTTHLNALQSRPEFFDVYLDLACEFQLPIRLESGPAEHEAGFPFRQLATEEGVLAPDHYRFVHDVDRATSLAECVADLEPGVTELSLQPAIDTPELQAADPTAGPARVAAAAALGAQSDLASAIEAAAVTLIDYRGIRRAMRAR